MVSEERIQVKLASLEGSEDVPVVLVRNSRARRYILRVSDEQSVRITVPRGGDRSGAMALLEKHRPWVIGRLRAIRDERQRLEKPWGGGTLVWFRGERMPLRDASGHQGYVLGSLEIAHSPKYDSVKALVMGTLLTVAREELPRRVGDLGRLMPRKPGRTTVRAQRTRWGSCSAKGTISLNWRLIQVPVEVRDYVVIHELCHLKQMNHSPKFWELVRHFCPQFRSHERWLRNHEREILAGT